MQPAGRPSQLAIAGDIGICKQAQADFFWGIAHPPGHPHVEAAIYVADQAVKPNVAELIPLANVLRKRRYGAEQIKARIARGISARHKGSS